MRCPILKPQNGVHFKINDDAGLQFLLDDYFYPNVIKTGVMIFEPNA